MLDLDFRSRVPIYEQLVEKFKELIITEVLKKDEQLPSIRALAKELTINPNTIQKAYRELEMQSYIYSVPGKGNFVAAMTNKINEERLSQLKEEMTKLLAEAMFLGLKREEILGIIEEIDKSGKGGRVR
ncbi:GntR family transcriptional regulator [Bacillota bacterium LX-D]|nr:GntR family transcriptional regulator [Bacillota bacterium LX-D]